MTKKDEKDVLEPAYQGPHKEVVAVGRGAIEGKVAFFVSPFIGATVGYLARESIESFLAKSAKANAFIDANVGLLGDGVKKWMSKYPGNKAMSAGAVAGMFVIPTIAGIHGAIEGYKDADAGEKQFNAVKDEIRALRNQVTTLKAENAMWAKRIEEEKQDREASKDNAPTVGA